MGTENFMPIQKDIIYEFDFDKIKTTEDVIRVLKSMKMSFGRGYPGFEEVKDLLKEVK